MNQIQATPRVFLAVPAYGQIMTCGTVSSLMSLQRELDARQMSGGFGTLSYPDIVEIRNIFLSIWYDRIQTSHMLFIDADMSFEPGLILDMLATNRPLVGALCPKKKYPIEFAGRAKLGDVAVVNGHMEVSGIGGAIMLIHRDVVTGMLEKWPELSDEATVKNHAAKDILQSQGVNRLIKAFDKIVVEGETFSEDLSFCRRWTECGGDVWANIMHRVGHSGMHEFIGCYYDQVKDHIKPGPEAAQIQPPVTAGGELVPSLIAAE